VVDPDQLQIKGQIRESALFNPALESKLPGCASPSLRTGMPVARALVPPNKRRPPIQANHMQRILTCIDADRAGY
jgi:hypothetical protein